jgi:hypothetical protein
MTIFWYVMQCSLADIDRCFRGAHYLGYQEDKWYEVIRSETSVSTYQTRRRKSLKS